VEPPGTIVTFTSEAKAEKCPLAVIDIIPRIASKLAAI
jgi:hypothetical protein